MFDGSRNPLAYPAGSAPGFNPSHAASRKMGPGRDCSIIASGGSYIDILTGRRATLLGGSGAGAKITAGLGPAMEITGTRSYGLTGMSTAAATGCTVAVIFSMSSLANFNSIFTPASSSSSFYITITTGVPYFNKSSNITFSNMACAINTPYFIAASMSSGAYMNFVCTNLSTGVVISQQVSTSITFPDPESTFTFGNRQAGDYPTNLTAAGMYNASGPVMSMTDMLAWAADPWSFWYPEGRG